MGTLSKLKNTKSTGNDQTNLQHIEESLIVTICWFHEKFLSRAKGIDGCKYIENKRVINTMQEN